MFRKALEKQLTAYITYTAHIQLGWRLLGYEKSQYNFCSYNTCILADEISLISHSRDR